MPVDVSRSLEGLLTAVDFDIVHVHDPFAPSAASAALRHSRALNAGTFHLEALPAAIRKCFLECIIGKLRVCNGRLSFEFGTIRKFRINFRIDARNEERGY